MDKILLSVLITLSTTLYSQSWEMQSILPTGRHHPISFAIDGKGYAATGTSFGQVTKDFYQYDPIADSWSQLNDFPGAARSFGIGVVNNGKAYLGFGANSQYLNDFWSYDPSDSSWTQLASCTCTGRRHPAMLTANNKVYVGMGDDFTGNLNDWWMYDISLNTWTQIASIPGPPRHHPFMFSASGKLFAGLGHGNNGAIYKDWYQLDTVLNTWTAMSQFPGEARVAGTQFSRNGYGYVLSGDGDNHSFMPTGEMWEYNPNTDSWVQLTPHPGESLWAPGSFVIDDAVYFLGGLSRITGIYPTQVWKYDFSDTSTTLNEEQLVKANTYAYPNPTSDVLFWENDQSISQVKIFSSNGKLVFESPATAGRLNARQFNNGLYLIQFYDRNNLIKSDKVIIQH